MFFVGLHLFCLASCFFICWFGRLVDSFFSCVFKVVVFLALFCLYVCLFMFEMCPARTQFFLYSKVTIQLYST